MAVISGSIAGNGSLFTIGPDVPDSTNRDRPWFRLEQDGSPDDFYVFYNGLWVAKHRTPASGQERRIWVGNETALKTYDGGSDAAITPTSGPFWDIDAEFAARFPVGVGEFPSGDDVAVGENGGAEKVALATEEVPSHRHPIGVEGVGDEDPTENHGWLWADGSGTNVNYDTDTPSDNIGYTRNAGGNPDENNETVGHNNLPPYRGVYIIKRTARVFKTVS